jgi:hypothetical protein
MTSSGIHLMMSAPQGFPDPVGGRTRVSFVRHSAASPGDLTLYRCRVFVIGVSVSEIGSARGTHVIKVPGSHRQVLIELNFAGTKQYS